MIITNCVCCPSRRSESDPDPQVSGTTVSKAALRATLSKLRYVEGASWDPRRVCLANTRNHIIEQVHSWVENADESRSTTIFLLTGVAGAGKSTVAHTIAQHYAGTKKLATSFFFDREINDRNNPKHLISTIASDLCRTDVQLARRIQSCIEEDERIAHAPISLQFEELVLRPYKDLPTSHPMVIVLDALDEGYDADLIWILCDRVCQLSRRICFFITSRVFPELEVLRQKPHVHSVALDIHTKNNMEDISLFVPHRLKQVSEYHALGTDWPGQELVETFTRRAEGLFLWAAIICDYLYTRSDPTSELQMLVSTSQASNVSAESKMDKLYSTILQTCNWDDAALVVDYHRLMGVIVATKTPLTLEAIGKLYQRTPAASNLLRRQLSPLLTGLGSGTDTTQPVRFIHHSLWDFLTTRAASSSPETHKFWIDERAHSQTLALLCLSQINRQLDNNIDGLGYLGEDDSVAPGIPSIAAGVISEELLYACRFWVDHLLDVKLPSSLPVLSYLEEFLVNRLTRWMELIAALGRYEGLFKLREWVKVGVNMSQ